MTRSIQKSLAGSLGIEWTGAGRSSPQDFRLPALALHKPAIDFKRLSIGFTVDAKRIEDNVIITVAIDRSKNFLPATDPSQVAPDYLRAVLREAAIDLQDKMTERKMNEAIPGHQLRAQPKTGEW